jgi:hypothetical protein
LNPPEPPEPEPLPQLPAPPTTTISVSPGVTAIVAVVDPPWPEGDMLEQPPTPPPPPAPEAVMVTCVTPAGTTKLCLAPVESKVSEPLHVLDAQLHDAPLGHVAVQSVHTPLAPQAPSELPALHVPPVDAEQQPPLQAWVEEHAEVHALFPQASFAGQSVVTLQPQVPPETHAVPEEPPAHELQVAPVAPHAVCEVPATHVPASQQPPLQGWVAEHAVVHAWVVVSQAWSAGQSAADAQQPVQASVPGPESWPES